MRPRGPTPSGAEALGLKVGDDVRHSKWGEGVILDIEGGGDKTEAVVRFPEVGEKRLLLAWAPAGEGGPVAQMLSNPFRQAGPRLPPRPHARACCSSGSPRSTAIHRPGRGGRRRSDAHHRQAADLVDRWAGGIAARVAAGRGRGGRHAERLRAAPAVPRRLAGRAMPAPVNALMRPDEIDHVESDSDAALMIHAVSDLPAARAARPRPSRPSPATSPRSSTRRAPPASPRASSSPTRACSRRDGRHAAAPAASATTRRWSACRSPTSWASRGARPGVRRHPGVLPAPLPPGAGARRHRDPPGHHLHRRAGHVPDAARGRRRGPRPHVGPGVGLGRRRDAGRAGRPLQEAWARPSRCRSSARSARPPSPRATAWSRPAAAWRPSCRRRCSAGGLGVVAGHAPARLLVQGGRRRRRRGPPGRGRRAAREGSRRHPATRATRRHRGHVHRRRLAAHRRPRPARAARQRRVLRRPQEGRHQARRLLRLRGRGRAGARAAPRRGRGGGRSACPTSARARSRPRWCGWPTGRRSTRRPCGVGRRAARRLQGAASASSSSTSCPAPAPQGPGKRAARALRRS